MAINQRISLFNPVHLLAVGLGSGLSPIMPGTMGTLMAMPIWYYLLSGLTTLIYWIVIVVAFVIGIYLCQKTADDMECHDPGSIVWDEFVGVWIVLFFIPTLNWQWVLIAFITFRIFDMWKVWPISWFDKNIKGGLGIMLDDVIAAIISVPFIIILSKTLSYS